MCFSFRMASHNHLDHDKHLSEGGRKGERDKGREGRREGEKGGRDGYNRVKTRYVHVHVHVYTQKHPNIMYRLITSGRDKGGTSLRG